MMLTLPANIGVNIVAFGMAHGKRTVSSLPREQRRTTIGRLCPLGRFRFYLLNKFCHRDSSRKPDKEMHMVNIATCRGAYTAGFLDMMSQHAKRRVSKCFVLEERASLFSREDDMEPNLGERLGHVNGSF